MDPHTTAPPLVTCCSTGLDWILLYVLVQQTDFFYFFLFWVQPIFAKTADLGPGGKTREREKGTRKPFAAAAAAPDMPACLPAERHCSSGAPSERSGGGGGKNQFERHIRCWLGNFTPRRTTGGPTIFVVILFVWRGLSGLCVGGGGGGAPWVVIEGVSKVFDNTQGLFGPAPLRRRGNSSEPRRLSSSSPSLLLSTMLRSGPVRFEPGASWQASMAPLPASFPGLHFSAIFSLLHPVSSRHLPPHSPPPPSLFPHSEKCLIPHTHPHVHHSTRWAPTGTGPSSAPRPGSRHSTKRQSRHCWRTGPRGGRNTATVFLENFLPVSKRGRPQL